MGANENETNLIEMGIPIESKVDVNIAVAVAVGGDGYDWLKMRQLMLLFDGDSPRRNARESLLFGRWRLLRLDKSRVKGNRVESGPF
jgi:hypothetical protein